MRNQLMMVLGLAVLGGCSTDYYRQSADTQVRQILEERKQESLGYKPRTEAPTTVSQVPKKRAYDDIPFTPLPPVRPSPMERDMAMVPYGPLGPSEEVVPESLVTLRPDMFGVEAAEERASRRHRLGPPPPDEHIQQLDLFRSIAYGAQHSRAYQTASEDLYLKTLDVTLQRHLLLEPQPFVNQTVAYTGSQQQPNISRGPYQSALSAITTAGVTQPLPYGENVTAKALVAFVDALNQNTESSESADVAMSASIPLLRGAGLVNLEPLIGSERDLVYAVRDFENFRRQYAVDVAGQYFQLLTNQQSVVNRRQNYTNLSLLTERTKALYSAGKITFLEVQQALQAQLTAETDLINSQEVFERAVDKLKVAIGMDVEDNLDIVPIELNVRVPDLDREDYLALATKLRLDLQTLRDTIDDKRRAVANATNGLLPDVQLTALGDAGNIKGTPAKALDARTPSYSASISIDLPVDRLRERNNYRTSLIDLQQAMRAYVDARQTILGNVRDTARQIRLDELTMEIQKQAIELGLRRVEYSNELLIQGTANSRDVVESQQDLLSSQDKYNSARADLQSKVLVFLNQTGTLRLDPDAGALATAMEKPAMFGADSSINIHSEDAAIKSD